jgi:hypothetical protein
MHIVLSFFLYLFFWLNVTFLHAITYSLEISMNLSNLCIVLKEVNDSITDGQWARSLGGLAREGLYEEMTLELEVEEWAGSRHANIQGKEIPD